MSAWHGGKGSARRPAQVPDEQVAANWPLPSPDWSEAPAWVKWFAVDLDGYAWFFEAEPVRGSKQWVSADRMVEAGFYPGARSRWRETLVERNSK